MAYRVRIRYLGAVPQWVVRGASGIAVSCHLSRRDALDRRNALNLALAARRDVSLSIAQSAGRRLAGGAA